MPAINVRKSLERFAVKHVGEMVPDDITVAVTVSVVQVASPIGHEEDCECEHSVFDHMGWLFDFIFMPDDAEVTPQQAYMVVPYLDYHDGDPMYLDDAINRLWEEVRFSQQMSDQGLSETLANIIAENGGESPLT